MGKKTAMRVKWATANNAFVFVCNDRIERMGNADMFLPTLKAAREAAAACGLLVTRDRYVIVDPAKCSHPADARVETLVKAAKPVTFIVCDSCKTTLETR